MSRFSPYHLPPNNPYLNLKGRFLRPKHMENYASPWDKSDIEIARQFWAANPQPPKFSGTLYIEEYGIIDGVSKFYRDTPNKVDDFTTDKQFISPSITLPSGYTGFLLIGLHDTENELIDYYGFYFTASQIGVPLSFDIDNPNEEPFLVMLTASPTINFYRSSTETSPYYAITPELTSSVPTNLRISIPTLGSDEYLFSLNPIF